MENLTIKEINKIKKIAFKDMQKHFKTSFLAPNIFLSDLFDIYFKLNK